MAAFPVPTPIFPTIPGLTFSVHKRPTWATLEFMAVSGRRVSSPQQAYPLWEFELTFDFLKDQGQNITPYVEHAGRHDFTLLSQLFLACAGKYGQFFFDDPTDDSRLGQIIGIGNGSTNVFTAQRTWGFGSAGITEPVGGINVLDNLYIGGVWQDPIHYAISGNVITLDSFPGMGVAVTLDFSFYYLCQFLEDQHDYEQFMYNLWTMKSLKMRSVKL